MDGPDNLASQAIDRESGDINWDCPCLKSALEPPCGDFFKEAFSCYVKSKTTPKGIDCHEYFKKMQLCFSEHPEKYSFVDETIEEIDKY